MSAGPDWFDDNPPDIPIPRGCAESSGPGTRGNECAICRGDLEADDQTVTHLECHNTWHKNCFLYALSSGCNPPRCPLCRLELQAAQIRVSVIAHPGQLADIISPDRSEVCMNGVSLIIAQDIVAAKMEFHPLTTQLFHTPMGATVIQALAQLVQTESTDIGDILGDLPAQIPEQQSLPYGLSATPSAEEIVHRMEEIRFSTPELDLIFSMVNFWGVKSFHYLGPVPFNPHRSFLLPQTPPEVICRDIQQVIAKAGVVNWGEATRKPSSIVQVHLTTQMVRLFLRTRCPERLSYAQSSVDRLNQIARELDVKFWVAFMISQKLYLCPWPKAQLPATPTLIAPPTAPAGWIQGAFSNIFSAEQTQQCRERVLQTLKHQAESEQTAQEEALQFWGPKCIHNVHYH